MTNLEKRSIRKLCEKRNYLPKGSPHGSWVKADKESDRLTYELPSGHDVWIESELTSSIGIYHGKSIAETLSHLLDCTYLLCLSIPTRLYQSPILTKTNTTI